MTRDIALYLEDIRESIHFIEEYLMGESEDSLRQNQKLQDAVVRRFEIIGEAAKQLPQEFKDSHREIPWKQMAGMRDFIAHEYFGVNIERVWNTIKQDLPALKRKISDIKIDA